MILFLSATEIANIASPLFLIIALIGIIVNTFSRFYPH